MFKSFIKNLIDILGYGSILGSFFLLVMPFLTLSGELNSRVVIYIAISIIVQVLYISKIYKIAQDKQESGYKWSIYAIFWFIAILFFHFFYLFGILTIKG